MKKFVMSGILSYIFISAGVLLAGQLILSNKSGKKIEFDLTFFHTKAGKKMVISDFQLEPNQKTAFPKQGELDLANPLKLKVREPKNMISEASIDLQDDVIANHIDVVSTGEGLDFRSSEIGK